MWGRMCKWCSVLSPGAVHHYPGLYHLIPWSNQRTHMVILSGIVRAREVARRVSSCLCACLLQGCWGSICT
jgi:hypothetical protein